MLSFVDLRTGKEFFGCLKTVLCLGNFDGVHKGHAELIRRTVGLRNILSSSVPEILGGAWCFRQLPADFLSPNVGHRQITTTDEKLEEFASLGLDIAILGDFEELRRLSPLNFIENTLKKECGCVSTVCGFNFRFGKDGKGTADDLVSAFGESAEVVPPVTLEGVTVSSSEIRKLILQGDTETAEKMLGRPYSLTATVEHGKKLGNLLGSPTINQFFDSNKLIPSAGVYIGTVDIEDKTYASVVNIGNNPTIMGNEKLRAESHIIGFSGDLYGKTVKTSFIKKIRAEQKFDSLEALKNAIQHDIALTKEYFNK